MTACANPEVGDVIRSEQFAYGRLRDIEDTGSDPVIYVDGRTRSQPASHYQTDQSGQIRLVRYDIGRYDPSRGTAFFEVIEAHIDYRAEYPRWYVLARRLNDDYSPLDEQIECFFRVEKARKSGHQHVLSPVEKVGIMKVISKVFVPIL